MNPDEMKESMFDEKNQHLEIIHYTENGIDKLCKLMGSNVQPRKEQVFNNIDFSNYGEV